LEGIESGLDPSPFQKRLAPVQLRLRLRHCGPLRVGDGLGRATGGLGRKGAKLDGGLPLQPVFEGLADLFAGRARNAVVKWRVGKDQNLRRLSEGREGRHGQRGCAQKSEGRKETMRPHLRSLLAGVAGSWMVSNRGSL